MSFAALHRPGDPLLLPNAWDFASGALLVRQGFPALGTTSLGVALAAGLPDGEDATRAETALVAQRLRRLPCYLTVDVERGFSDDPGEVAAFAAALPADGINLEDAMGDPELLCRKISAVKAAAPHLFVNARTDTYWQREGSVAETRRRLDAYIEAGADGVFVPGVRDPAAIAAFVAIGRPLNVLLSPDGLSLTQLAELGVARVSTGSLLFRLALGSLRHWATGDPAAPGYAETAALAFDSIR